MAEIIKVNIYGDSIMRGTVIDENSRYHSVMNSHLEQLQGQHNIEFRNRARFGITVEKGFEILKKDLERGLDCDYAVLEFGGNDCSFLWQDIAKDPKQNHQPLTPRESFASVLAQMVEMVKAAGITPVLVTLPPIDAQRHLQHIGKTDEERQNILQWLGDANMIYRFHEMYSRTVEGIAAKAQTLLVDVRMNFLDRHDLTELIGQDGVHPSTKGYELYIKAFTDFIHAQRGQNRLCPST